MWIEGNRSCIDSIRMRISGRREVLVLWSSWNIRLLGRFVSLWGNRKLWRSVLITLVKSFLWFYVASGSVFRLLFTYLIFLSLEFLQLNQAWVFRNTLGMKSLVYGTLVILLMGNWKMSFSASDLLLLRVSLKLNCSFFQCRSDLVTQLCYYSVWFWVSLLFMFMHVAFALPCIFPVHSW